MKPITTPTRYPTVTAREHLTAMAISKSKEAEYKAAAAAKKDNGSGAQKEGQTKP